ncbi:VanW family protein [Neolewinella lacunae]|uniref:VanW family protein n=1 Tax=Neolewinella lacunae TaxID=1517758 RepID=A0A923PM21_9BACT|nr:VanW family protein [Neolewinella lacunae]MBC6993007.1 VanW family protein [Neolewinella lacunae]MDN3635797.1 VanW family protein [Neolewinella lacunae]
MMRRFIPPYVKVRLNLLKSKVHDVLKGHYFYYAKARKYNHDLINVLSLEQELKPNEAKITNLLVAIKRIESIQINPNEIFSFWHVVGEPSQKKGFVKSRSLIRGKVEDSVGGGLCQLSGLIYYLSLYASLEIIERHSYSIDIYTDETRFAPLGSDATVAFGYKDLKIRNNLNGPIRFKFELLENEIIVSLMHASVIQWSATV